MKPVCPNCDQAIAANQINVGTDMAFCSRCNEAYALSALVAADDAVELNLDDPPRGVWFEREMMGFTLGGSTRSAAAFFLVPFMTVWSGFSLGGIYGSQIVAGKFNVFMSLFGIPFVLGTLMFGSLAVMSVCGKVVVSVDRNDGRIFTGVGPFGWSRRFNWSSIVRVEEEQSRTSKGGAMTSLALISGQARLKFGSMLNDARRYFVLQALRKLLAERSVPR